MALLGEHIDLARPSRMLNKKLMRNAGITVLLFLFTTAFLLHRRNESNRKRPELPRNVLWPEPEEVGQTYNFPTTSEFQPVRLDAGRKTTEELCASFPRHMLSRVQPVLKMGFSEKRDKVDSQLDSVSACFTPEDLLIFSDSEEELRGYHVIDVLAYLPDTYRNNPNFTMFEQYLVQKEMRDNGTLRVGQDTSGKIDGWAMDKFKFLPAVERAWAMKPDKEFYVFYETDTYILWDNMFRFLDTLDPETPLYIGSASPGRIDGRREQGTLFANGGPGYILSRGAMKKLLHRRVGPTGTYIDPAFSEKFRYLATDAECCGDSILGFAAWELGIILQGYYPLFTPYNLKGLPYNDGHWCHPLITMHKVSPANMVKLWKWEFQHRRHGTPIMYSDLWNYFRPGLVQSREDWDSDIRYSFEPPAEQKPESAEQCQNLCRADEKCMQWLWKGRDRKTCHLMHLIHHGGPHEAHEEDGKWIDYTAGWMSDRVEKWVQKKCERADWVGASLKRIF